MDEVDAGEEDEIVGEEEEEEEIVGDDDDDDEDESDEDVKDMISSTEKFIRTFHNGDYDAEFDNVLSFDRGVIPLFWSTQASYNKPDNWVERNRIGLEKVKDQLQDCIDKVSDDKSFNLHLSHNFRWRQWGSLRDNEWVIVWNTPILDRCWDLLEAEIDARKQQEVITDIRGINIENVEMKKERIAALVAIFFSGRATNSSDGVIFNNANLCAEGIISLAKLVEVSLDLQYFSFHHNRIDSIESARCLSRSLKSHTCINRICLNHCDFGSNPEILLIILQSDVSHINLRHNNIDSLGAVKIAEYLESDPPIHSIDLDYNRLNDDDAILISRALKRNTNLHKIDLASNKITSIGVKALLTCVFDSSSLNAISESNNTLKEINVINGWEGDNMDGCSYVPSLSEILEGNIRKLLRLDRTQKIMLALQDKDSLLQYLANVPVELIPEVLAFPLQQNCNQRQHRNLNVVYSTMRWWNMPMLYSYHCCVKSDTKRKRSN
jgi:hypothetical protein